MFSTVSSRTLRGIQATVCSTHKGRARFGAPWPNNGTAVQQHRNWSQVEESTNNKTTISYAVPSWWVENMRQNLPEAAWNWYDSHYKYMYM